MKKNHLSLSFPALLDYIPAVRNLVRETLVSFGYDEKDSFRNEVIADELCTNAVIYGSTKPTDCVVMAIDFNDNSVDLRVEDNGNNEIHKERLKQFYKDLSKNDDVSDSRQDSRGIALVKLISDELSISINEFGETEIRAVKYKSPVGVDCLEGEKSDKA